MRGRFPYYGASGVVDYVNDYLFDEDLILLGEDGENILSRVLPLAFKVTGKTWVNNHAHVLRPKTSFDIDYLTAYLESIDYSQLNTGTAQPKLNKQSCLTIKIPTPPPEHQRRIATIISATDRLIEAIGQLVIKKEEIKQGMMQYLVTGRARLSGFTQSWAHVTWGEVTERCVSGTTPLRSRADFWGNEIPWVTSTELKYGTITHTPQAVTIKGLEATNLIVWPAGTFLMAITGLEAVGTRGSCALLGLPAATNQSCMAIIPNDRLRTEFLYYFYLLRGEELALRYCQGTKQQSYTAQVVKSLPIYLPTDIKEQLAIAGLLFDLDAEINALRSCLAKRKSIKQGMMQELLAGRTRLRVMEKATS
jgi:type I restriction enzyme S subunit